MYGQTDAALSASRPGQRRASNPWPFPGARGGSGIPGSTGSIVALQASRVTTDIGELALGTSGSRTACCCVPRAASALCSDNQALRAGCRGEGPASARAIYTSSVIGVITWRGVTTVLLVTASRSSGSLADAHAEQDRPRRGAASMPLDDEAEDPTPSIRDDFRLHRYRTTGPIRPMMTTMARRADRAERDRWPAAAEPSEACSVATLTYRQSRARPSGRRQSASGSACALIYRIGRCPTDGDDG